MKKLKALGSIIGEFGVVVRSGCKLIALTWSELKVLMICTLIAVVIASVAPFVQNWAMGRFINQLVQISGSAKESSVSWGLLYWAIVISSCYSIANCLQFFLKTSLYKEVFQRTTTMISERVANLDLQSHEDPVRKDLITTVLEKAMWHSPDFMQRMTYLLQNCIEVAIASLIFVHADPIAGIVMATFMLPRLILEIVYNHELWKTEKKIAEVRRKFWYARYFISDLRSLTEVKLYQNVRFFVRRVGQHLGLIKDQELCAERKNIKLQLGALVASEIAAAWIIMRFVGNVVAGEMNIGTLTFYISSMINFRFALNSLCQNVGSQFRDGKFVSDMFEAFNLKPKLPVIETSQIEVPNQIREVRFENVHFAYPGTTAEVLKGITFTLQKGQTLGLVAENGSGKTTLVKLLCRLYDPTQGRILINGIDIRQFPINQWQNAIGVLLQEYNHYEHLTVRTAIALGREPDDDHDMNRIVDAAKAAGAHDFIMKFPDGYDTTLGRAFDGGVELSGGQYQRLAIARLFYRRAAISIFDEPTSAVDGAAEARIFEEILDEKSESIKILISHRFSTLRRAHSICVIENGTVREAGSHQDLMQLGGTYAQRYTEQASSYH